MKRSLLFLTINFSFLFASTLSEKEILLIALKSNTDINLINCDKIDDSLDLELKKAGWLPKTSFSISPNIHSTNNSYPTYDLNISNTNQSTSELNAEAQFSQFLPGGAELKSTLSASSYQYFKSDSNFQSGKISLSISQPILKNSFQLSDIAYQVRLKKMDSNLLSLERKKNLLTLLSNIRNLFWNYYEQKTLSKIFEQEIQKAQLILETERIRFSIGESSSLDTLNALIELMTAKQSLLESQIHTQQARNKLALSLMIPVDSLNINDSLYMINSQLPDPQTLIKMVQKYDPSLKGFEIIAKKISLQHQKLKNQLLPSIDLIASITYSKDEYLNNQKHNNAVVGCLLTFLIPSKENNLSKKQLFNQSKREKLQKNKYLQELYIKLNDLQQSWNQEIEKIKIAELVYELSINQLFIAQKSYEIGTIERLVLIDAQKKLTQSNLNLIHLKISLKQLEIAFDEITGSLFNRFNLLVD